MSSEREGMENWSLGKLADAMGESGPGMLRYHAAQAEILRRQTVLQQETGEAQRKAADATIETARFTRLNARYMLASVIVLALASVANLLVSVFLR